MPASRGRILDGIGTLARLGLAAVWLVSGGMKLSDPGQTYLAVQAYDVLPEEFVGVVATGMPLLEIALGFLLVVGMLTRASAGVSALVLLVFIAAVAQSWARGLTIDCGCFGGGGQVEPGQTRYPQEIARDLGFLVLAGWLLVRPGTLVSMDGWLGLGRARIRQAPGSGGQDTFGTDTPGRNTQDEDVRKDFSGRSGTDGAQTATATTDREN